MEIKIRKRFNKALPPAQTTTEQANFVERAAKKEKVSRSEIIRVALARFQVEYEKMESENEGTQAA